MNIFLTGTSGFVGRHVALELIKRGHRIRALVRRPDLLPADLKNSMNIIQGDICHVTQSTLEGTDAVIHMAAAGVEIGKDTWPECMKINVGGLAQLISHMSGANIKKLLILGSCFEYGKAAEAYEEIPTTVPLKPEGPYATSKAVASQLAEAMAQQHGLNLAIARCFHIYGPGEASYRFWPQLVKAAQSGSDFKMTLGEQIRDFMPVEAAARQIIDIAMAQTNSPSINAHHIASGQPQKLCDFARKEWERLGATGKILFGAIPYRPNECMKYIPEIT